MAARLRQYGLCAGAHQRTIKPLAVRPPGSDRILVHALISHPISVMIWACPIQNIRSDYSRRGAIVTIVTDVQVNHKSLNLLTRLYPN